MCSIYLYLFLISEEFSICSFALQFGKLTSDLRLRICGVDKLNLVPQCSCVLGLSPNLYLHSFLKCIIPKEVLLLKI